VNNALEQAKEDIVTRLHENADLDEMEHCNPIVIAMEREAADEIERLRTALSALSSVETAAFQQRVQPWMLECFGPEISANTQERNHRFLEESLELVQACGATQSEAHQLVDYVYGRPVGDRHQEVGGVMVTLAALCLAQGLDMHAAGETELVRIWTKVDQIRAKQAAKPKHSPLPVAVAAQQQAAQPAPAGMTDTAMHMYACDLYSELEADPSFAMTCMDGTPNIVGVIKAVLLARSNAPQPEADPQLLKFYQVETFPDLVLAMERHIEKLQSKLPPAPDVFTPRFPRG
jgi:hypothetical protein